MVEMFVSNPRIPEGTAIQKRYDNRETIVALKYEIHKISFISLFHSMQLIQIPLFLV